MHSKTFTLLFSASILFNTFCNSQPKQSTPLLPLTQEIKIMDMSFEPNEIKVTQGQEVDLIFNRVSDSPCGKVIVFPSENISKELAVGEKFTVSLKPRKSGPLLFSCGMNMMKGALIVREPS